MLMEVDKLVNKIHNGLKFNKMINISKDTIEEILLLREKIINQKNIDNLIDNNKDYLHLSPNQIYIDLDFSNIKKDLIEHYKNADIKDCNSIITIYLDNFKFSVNSIGEITVIEYNISKKELFNEIKTIESIFQKYCNNFKIKAK
jgi:hypothetical protein